MNPEFEQKDPNQPIAYDANGQPLYATPNPQSQADQAQTAPTPNSAQPIVTGSPDQQRQHNAQTNPDQVSRASHVTTAPAAHEGHNFNPRMRTQYGNEPTVVHEPRQVEPAAFEISDEVKDRHEKSRGTHPHLNLSEGEFVILDIKRHPIGMIPPLLGGGIVLLALTIVLIVYPMDGGTSGMPSFAAALMICSLLMILVGIGTFIALWVYLQNQFYMTNESVIQEIQHSLFSKREQTVSLGSIEDASYKQTGILQTMLNYGTIRLSTEGEETTYRFAYVANPRDQVAIINNGIESFKNGRPVDPGED